MVDNNTRSRGEGDDENYDQVQSNFEDYVDLMKADIIALDEPHEISPVGTQQHQQQIFSDDRNYPSLTCCDGIPSTVLPFNESFYSEKQESFNIYAPEDCSSLLSLPRTDLNVTTITETDVLCGRGAGANHHPGNISFRSMIIEYNKTYLSAKAIEKTEIAKSIVLQVKKNGGRFMKRATLSSDDDKSSPESVTWVQLCDKAAHEKVCQALRERGPSETDIPVRSTNVARLPIDDLEVRLKSTLEARIIVRDEDVLFGRGGVTNSHVGNQHYRDLVRARQRQYLEAPKLKKANVAMEVVEEIYFRGGRFLSEKNGEWQVVTKEKAREKVSQALREKAPEIRKRIAPKGQTSQQSRKRRSR